MANLEAANRPKSSSSKFQISKWIVYLFSLLFIALLVLAIVLPLTITKTDTVTETVERMVEVTVLVDVQNIPSVDAISDIQDPFERFQSVTSRTVYERIANVPDLLLGQATQFSKGDTSGPRIADDTDEFWLELIAEGRIGSLFNVNDWDHQHMFQTAAMETDAAIPILFGFDTIHGYKTIFPLNLGMAASFDRELAEKAAGIAAKESKADGILWTFAPMLDISRDPRWGRISESFGEDAYLTGELGVAFVKGFQDNGVAACVKHVAAYGAAQAGRDYHTAQLGEAYLHNDYLPAYKKVLDAGALTAMASFNTVAGVPSHANKQLLTDILRGKWGWDGLIVGDYNGIAELMNHRVAKDEVEAARLAMIAGVDMSMADGLYLYNLTDSLEEVDEHAHSVKELLQLATRRILAVKEKLGLFNENVWNSPKPQNPWRTAEYLEAAREAAEKSMVLLKNVDKTLPLSRTDRVLLLGKIADTKLDMLGSWAGRGADGLPEENTAEVDTSEIITIKAGLNAANPTLVTYLQGYEGVHRVEDDDERLRNEAVDELKKSTYKAVIVVVGETWLMNGEAASRTNLTLSGAQLDLIKAMHSTIRGMEPAPKLVVAVNAGRPLILEWEDANVDAILQTWSAGTMAGAAVDRVIYGDVSPGGKMPVTTPRNVGQIPIYYSMLNTGRPLTKHPDDEPWEGTGAWYESHYLDSRNSPLYPFGYGLSYSSFAYSDFTVDDANLNSATGGERRVEVSVVVTNEDPTNWPVCAEIVQLYVRDMDSSISPPQKLLRGFERIQFTEELTSRKVEFTLYVERDFGFYDNTIEWIVEPGSFEIIVAPNSSDESLKQTVVLLA